MYSLPGLTWSYPSHSWGCQCTAYQGSPGLTPVTHGAVSVQPTRAHLVLPQSLMGLSVYSLTGLTWSYPSHSWGCQCTAYQGSPGLTPVTHGAVSVQPTRAHLVLPQSLMGLSVYSLTRAHLVLPQSLMGLSVYSLPGLTWSYPSHSWGCQCTAYQGSPGLTPVTHGAVSVQPTRAHLVLPQSLMGLSVYSLPGLTWSYPSHSWGCQCTAYQGSPGLAPVTHGAVSVQPTRAHLVLPQSLMGLSVYSLPGLTWSYPSHSSGFTRPSPAVLPEGFGYVPKR